MRSLTLEDLDEIYRPPGRIVLEKTLDHVDRHGRAFIALSPFCVVGAVGPDRGMDVSPRGGEPGFVQVAEDGKTVYLPDRPGNNRLDILKSLLGGNRRIGMMFMIPGFDDVYRVNGRVTATDDAALLARFEEFGRLPKVVLAVAVDEAFLHCPKALMRARLWAADAQVPRDRLPSGAEMVMDQLNLGAPQVSNETILEGYKSQF